MTKDDIVTEEQIEHYLDLTSRARQKATLIPGLGEDDMSRIKIMLRMSDDYYSDAKYFKNQGDYVRAFGAINYAHAWIDAGVKIGLLDGHGDDVLFTLP